MVYKRYVQINVKSRSLNKWLQRRQATCQETWQSYHVSLATECLWRYFVYRNRKCSPFRRTESRQSRDNSIGPTVAVNYTRKPVFECRKHKFRWSTRLCVCIYLTVCSILCVTYKYCLPFCCMSRDVRQIYRYMKGRLPFALKIQSVQKVMHVC